jgi:hypothetical protein
MLPWFVRVALEENGNWRVGIGELTQLAAIITRLRQSQLAVSPCQNCSKFRNYVVAAHLKSTFFSIPEDFEQSV